IAVPVMFGPSSEPPPAVSGSAAAPAGPHSPPTPIPLEPAPRSEDAGPAASVVCSAVLGLFPLAHQGLLPATPAMCERDALGGPVKSFLRADATLDAVGVPPDLGPSPEEREKNHQRRPRVFTDERLVTVADPCQSRAVALARSAGGLVVHGPPGTGKSQTITNIIGDHLARGQRVLFVCDKRTALDVVFNRLEHLGLGRLCALVHD